MFVLFIIACFTIPLLSEYLNKRFQFFNKLGTIFLCYIGGLTLSQFLNHTESLTSLQETISGLSVFIAIPILLFSIKANHIRLISSKMALSAVLALVSLVLVVGVGHVLFRNSVPEFWKVSGLMIGVYTGGTPNLASIKAALDVSSETYISIHTFDTFLGALYIVLLLAVGGFRSKDKSREKEEFVPIKRMALIFSWLGRSTARVSVLEVLLAIFIAAISIGVSIVITGEVTMTFVILSLTTLSVIIGLYASRRAFSTIEGPGYYFLNVFSFSVASMANISQLLANGTALLSYVAFVLFASFVLHIVLSRLFKVDVATIMVTSVALICSPPFVPIVTKTYKRADLMLPGLMIGIIGYVVGNYLGVLFAQLIK